MSARRPSYYPLFADLTGRACVVIGGGIVAQRKVAMLLRCGAQVTVVSPSVTRRLRVMTRSGHVVRRARRFRPADLRGAWLAIAATDNPATNQAVSRTAGRRRIFVNVVDETPLCTFIAPAIATRGLATVAVSTGGGSPALAKRLRDEVSRILDNGYAPMLGLLAGLRPSAKRRLSGAAARKRYFEALVEGEAFGLVRQGRRRRARQVALALLARHAARNGG